MVSIRIARTSPSAAKPMVAVVSWSRAWASESRVSERVAVHFTGRRRIWLAQTMVLTSGVKLPLTPKPPPTSGEMTRILCSGMCNV